VEFVGQQLPLIAAALAIPQFAPQFLRLLRTRDPSGVSWTGLSLTCVNNCAWVAYFMASGYTLAPLTAGAVALGAGATAALLSHLRRTSVLDVARVSVWGIAVVGLGLAGNAALFGTALTIAATAQMCPSVWSAYRADRATGVSLGTWVLVVGELACWGAYGVYQSDPRLIALGAVGALGGSLVAVRVLWGGRMPSASHC
jgi:uncharacterized protein with PQ loop repeat